MDRYSKVTNKNVREIVLLKALPCIWGKCAFCDYIDDNGWYYDSAQIYFKYFKTKTVDGKTITIESPLTINGFEILKYKSNRTAQFFNYCGVAFRGKEVDINPQKEKIQFNIWVK